MSSPGPLHSLGWGFRVLGFGPGLGLNPPTLNVAPLNAELEKDKGTLHLSMGDLGRPTSKRTGHGQRGGTLGFCPTAPHTYVTLGGKHQSPHVAHSSVGLGMH